jgi:hypothetical protein
MAGDITTWDELLASTVAATEDTLELFIPYVLIIRVGKDWRVTERVTFYGGNSVLRRELPSPRNTGPYKAYVGDTVVTIAHIGKLPLVFVRPAIIYGLADPKKVANPHGHKRQYACVRLTDMPQLRLSKAALSATPSPQSNTQAGNKEETTLDEGSRV